MTLVKDIRKTVTDTTPVYAALGVTDLAVERLRDARTRAAAVRHDLDITVIQDRAAKRFEKVTEKVQQIPEQVRSQSVEVAGKARETYTGLAARGEKMVKRVRNQKSTKDLFAQAGSTVSLGKGAVTTVRNAAHDTQRAARVTLATGRREAGSVAASVQDDVRAAGLLATQEPVATPTVPTVVQGTGTPAKKSPASTQRASRSAATGARKTAAPAAKTVTDQAGE
jgi:tartrate dehydratase beta subunit/fumarate hydratase class I family protein